MTAKLLFSFLVGVSLFGLILGYSGIARLKRAGVPPFNTGLYSAVYSISLSSGEILRVWNSLPGRLLLPVSGVALPLGCAVGAFRYERALIGYFLLFLWAGFTGVVGIWTWVFSLFAG